MGLEPHGYGKSATKVLCGYGKARMVEGFYCQGDKFLVNFLHTLNERLLMSVSDMVVQDLKRKAAMAKPKPSKKGDTGKRYSDAQRNQILKFFDKQKAIGPGASIKTQTKYNVSYIALSRWLKLRDGTLKPKRQGRPPGTAKPTGNMKKMEKTLQLLLDGQKQLKKHLGL